MTSLDAPDGPEEIRAAPDDQRTRQVIERIAEIDPDSGNVLGWIDLNRLLTQQERANSDVLNGIAYDFEQDRLFVTGKLWPTLFEIKLIPVDGSK